MNRDIVRILEEVCAHDNSRKHLKEPFQRGDEIYSTDGKFLVITPATDELKEKYKTVLDIGVIHDCDFSVPSITISSKELIDFCESLPEKPSYKTLYQTHTCADCSGDGEVNVKYRSKFTNSTYTIKCTCPVCGGSGEVTVATQVEDPSKMVPDEEVVVEFIGLNFDFPVFNKLVYVIKETGVDNIEVFGVGSHVMYININKDIKVAMCVCVIGSESRRIFKFKH